MPRVLIIAHHFPPAGTGGVGRALGWARHLPGLGWDVTVLAATPAPDWPKDESLLQQIPGEVTVHRLASSDPRPARFRGFGQRELSFLWFGPALSFARTLLGRERFDVILATVPPPAAHRLAAHLGAEFDIPWVADFRDPWAVRAPSLWRLWRRRVYASRAAACVAVNRALAFHLESALGRRVTTIFNGFEADEMPRDVVRVPRRAVYLGTLSAHNAMDGLYKALAHIDGEFLHIGRQRHHDISLRALAAGLKRVEQSGYLPRLQALRRAATGSVFITSLDPDLVLPLPTKVFDYIGLGGPILHVGHAGAASEFIETHHLGETVGAHEVPQLSQALLRLCSRPPVYPPELKARFERRRQAEATSELLAQVVKGARP